MIAKLKGIVDEIEEGQVVLDVSGVGYEVLCPNSVLSQLSQGEKTTLYTQMVVREDSISLFGFSSKNEKEWFNILTTVQGVGPKVGLAIMSILSVSQIHSAILSQDYKAFKNVSGIGNKLAERIVNELKTKKEIAMGATISANFEVGSGAKASATANDNNVVNDAVLALANLGFSRSDAFTHAVKIHAENSNIDLSDLIKQCLNRLTGN